MKKKIILINENNNLNLSWWISRFNGRKYNSQEDALKDIQHVVDKSNNDPLNKIFGSKDIDPQQIIQMFKYVPLKTGGKLVSTVKEKSNKQKFADNWNEIDVKQTSRDTLYRVAQSNFNNFEINFTPKLINIYDYIDKEMDDYYFANEKTRLLDLANKIKENKWVEPVIVEPDDVWLIEGQHRIRALALLKFKKCPAYEIFDKD